MSRAKTLLVGISLLLSSGIVWAQTRPPLPAVVITHMQSLDARCRAAGGQPGNGRYVIAQDFTGDGVADYLLSEGNYTCTGQPNLFRQNGQARVDIFVTDRANNALRAYSETLIAFRVLAGQPAKVQIARKGVACGPQAGPGTQCAAQLAWNGKGFGEDASVSDADRPAGQPGAASAKAAPAAPAAPAATPGSASTASPASGALAVLAVLPDAQPRFLAQCRKDLVSRDASAAQWADEECKSGWQRIVASGPAADALLAVVPASASDKPSLAAVKQRATGVRWSGRAAPPDLATGQLGGLGVSITGQGHPTGVSVNWQEVGAEIAYDVAGALRARGVTVTEMSCEKTGVGAGNRLYAGTAPGRAPFTLTVEQQTAPLGHMPSFYMASISLDGRHPPRGALSGCDF